MHRSRYELADKPAGNVDDWRVLTVAEDRLFPDRDDVFERPERLVLAVTLPLLYMAEVVEEMPENDERFSVDVASIY